MARPLKQDADWFKHDKDMRDDPKVKALRRKFGLEGYAVYVMMIEMMVDSNGFFTVDNPENMELSAGDIGIEPSRLCEILDYCVQIGLFYREALYENNTPVLSSRRLKLDMQAVLDSRNLDRESFRRRKYTEESRVEESRKEGEKTAPSSAPPTPQEKPCTKVDTLISALHDVEPGLLVGLEARVQLAQLAGAVDPDTIVAVFKFNQKARQPKSLTFFLKDFSAVRAQWEKVRPAQSKPKREEEPVVRVTEAEAAAIKAQALAGGNPALRIAALSPPAEPVDDFEDDIPFPEAK